MYYSLMKTAILFALLVVSNSVIGADKLSEEIQHLLKYVSVSECIFIRYGKSYDSDKTVSHMKKKYAHFKDKISTAEEFIEFSASKSMISNKPYLIECEGQFTQTSKQWLLDELISYREGNS